MGDSDTVIYVIRIATIILLVVGTSLFLFSRKKKGPLKIIAFIIMGLGLFGLLTIIASYFVISGVTEVTA